MKRRDVAAKYDHHIGEKYTLSHTDNNVHRKINYFKKCDKQEFATVYCFRCLHHSVVAAKYNHQIGEKYIC